MPDRSDYLLLVTSFVFILLLPQILLLRDPEAFHGARKTENIISLSVLHFVAAGSHNRPNINMMK